MTSSEQQARTQSLSVRTTRGSMAVAGLFRASLTLTLAFWCCLEKQVSGSAADAGGVASIKATAAAETSSWSVHEGRRGSGGNMVVVAVAGPHSLGGGSTRTNCWVEKIEKTTAQCFI